jgi:photosystem II stability/assembly factor-like uncharacterized protein
MILRPLTLALLLLSAPLQAGENVWTPIGPEGGSVTALAFTANGRTVYAGTQDTGVFKSVDAGRSWSLTDTRLHGAVQDLATVPSRNSATVYVATSRGIWKSADAGATWRDLTPNLPGLFEPPDVRIVVVDPLFPDTVYVSLVGSGAPLLFRSTDGGASWQIANTGLTNASAVRAIAVHPGKRGVLFAATSDGIFRSNDSGRTWHRSGPSRNDVFDVEIDPLQPSRLYAVRLESPPFPPHPEILFSENEGGSWRASRSPIASSGPGRLAADPFTSGTAYFFSPSGDVYKTTDAGRTWTAAPLRDTLGGTAHSRIQALDFHPRQPGTILLGRFSAGDHVILRTTNGGASVSRSGAGLRAWGLRQVVADTGTPGVLYTHSLSVLWKSEDGGQTWRQLPVPEEGGGISRLVLDPLDTWTLYLAATLYTYKSTDGGETWRRLDGAPPLAAALAIDPIEPGTLYGGNHYATLYKSTDAGEHWTLLPATNAFGATILTVDPNRHSTLYANMRHPYEPSHVRPDSVHRSTDGGAVWTKLLEPQVPPQTPQLAFWDIAVQPGNSNRVLAAFSRNNVNGDPIRGGVYQTSDGGATWSISRLSAENPPALSLLFMPLRPSRVYAGSTGQAFVSDDAGATWTFLGRGLPSVPVTDLEAAPFLHDTVYAATPGGLFILTRTGH